MTDSKILNVPIDDVTVPATVGFMLRNNSNSFLCEHCNSILNLDTDIDVDRASSVTIECSECYKKMDYESPFHDYINIIGNSATVKICDW